MSRYYATTLTQTLIGSKTSDGTRTGIELESTYQAESATEATKTLEVGGFVNINLDINYVMGASETANSIEVKLEGSPDGINFYPLAIDVSDGPTGTSTLTAREFKFVGTNGAAAPISIFLEVGYKFLRASFKETGVAANKGNVYVEVTLSGK